MTQLSDFVRPEVLAILIVGAIAVGVFDYVTRRMVLRRPRVLFTILPRQGRVIEHAHKDRS